MDEDSEESRLLVGVAFDGIAIYKSVFKYNLNGFDPLYPSAVANQAPPEELVFDNCLGYFDDWGTYRYYTASPCIDLYYLRSYPTG